MTVSWQDHAERLAETLTASGTLRSPAWEEAVRRVPRHVFVPYFFEQHGAEWDRIDNTNPQLQQQWLSSVYSDLPLTTALAPASVGLLPISSSTKPGLMLRMLEALDVREGSRVLEIGTGTGYNAALLAARLGDAQVFSVDIEPELVDLARERLAQVGYAPILATTDGAHGFPVHAPFDRLIATCSVPAVPWAWHEQIIDGGLILTDLKPAANAGSLVLLRRRGDRLEGRFLPKWAGFMALRHEPGAGEIPPSGQYDHDQGHARTTVLSPSPWDNLVAWFLAHLTDPAQTTFGYRLDADGGNPTHTMLTSIDGSWAAVSLTLDAGERIVAEGGPRRLWSALERAHDRWDQLGQPNWDRLGLTVTEHEQRVWLDRPDGQSWALPIGPDDAH